MYPGLETGRVRAGNTHEALTQPTELAAGGLSRIVPNGRPASPMAGRPFFISDTRQWVEVGKEQHIRKTLTQPLDPPGHSLIYERSRT